MQQNNNYYHSSVASAALPQSWLDVGVDPNDFKDRWIQKLTDDWPGSTQTEVSFKSTFRKAVNFQFYIRRRQVKPIRFNMIEVPKSTYWGRPLVYQGKYMYVV